MWLKSVYQTVKVRAPEYWSSLFYSYKQNEVIAALEETLASRFKKGLDKKINVLLVCPIVNWENQLLNSLKHDAHFAHLDFGQSIVFESFQEWNKSKENNLKKLRYFHEKHYKANAVNIIFLYISDFHISADLTFLKRENSIVVLFTWDDRLQFNSNVQGQRVGIIGLAKQVDLVLNMTVSSLPRYVLNKIPVLNWNLLVDNFLTFDVLHENLPARNDETVMFFGNNYGFREKLINHLSVRNIPMQLYGEGWGTSFLPYDQLWKKIPRVSLNLGISTVGYTSSIFCLKGRDFEVPGAGGLYLVNSSAELNAVYNTNEDVLAYENLEKCYSKCADVLANSSKYEKIRLNGYRTANKYKWPHRVNALRCLIERHLI